MQLLAHTGHPIRGLYSSAFHCYDKIPEKINLQGGMVYFVSWFERFQSMVTWPVAAQIIMVVGVCDQAKLLASWRLRSKRERRKVKSPKIYFKDMSQSDPTSYQFASSPKCSTTSQ
jgi:hypothetical protein